MTEPWTSNQKKMFLGEREREKSAYAFFQPWKVRAATLCNVGYLLDRVESAMITGLIHYQNSGNGKIMKHWSISAKAHLKVFTAK